MSQPTQSPAAESVSLSDAAVAQAFREAVAGSFVHTTSLGLFRLIELRARGIDDQLHANANTAPDVDDAIAKVAEAYGYLWHVNNPEDVPHGHPFVLPKRAAYEARKLLRDLLTGPQRGEAINAVREKLTAALNPGVGDAALSERTKGEAVANPYGVPLEPLATMIGQALIADGWDTDAAGDEHLMESVRDAVQNALGGLHHYAPAVEFCEIHGHRYVRGCVDCSGDLDALEAHPPTADVRGDWVRVVEALKVIGRWGGPILSGHISDALSGEVAAAPKPEGVSELRLVAKRNLRSMIERGSSDRELMLKCLEELS